MSIKSKNKGLAYALWLATGLVLSGHNLYMGRGAAAIRHAVLLLITIAFAAAGFFAPEAMLADAKGLLKFDELTNIHMAAGLALLPAIPAVLIWLAEGAMLSKRVSEVQLARVTEPVGNSENNDHKSSGDLVNRESVTNEDPDTFEEGAIVEGAVDLDALDGKKDGKVEVCQGRSIPIRVVIGFLEDVQARDAEAYATGFIARHFEAHDRCYWVTKKLGNGYLYEIHEGGDGYAFLPDIIKALETTNSVYIPTSSRYVKIERRDGKIVSLLMPEGHDAEITAGIKCTEKMTPYVGYAKHWLFIGLAIFVLGVATAGVGGFVNNMTLITQVNPANQKQVTLKELPTEQWKSLHVPQGKYMAALRFENGRWVRDIKPLPGAETEKPDTPSKPGDENEK